MSLYRNTMFYLILFNDTFTGLEGNIDRLYDNHHEADLYCTAQNFATMRLGKPTIEHWIVVINLNEANAKVAHRVYNPKSK